MSVVDYFSNVTGVQFHVMACVGVGQPKGLMPSHSYASAWIPMVERLFLPVRERKLAAAGKVSESGRCVRIVAQEQRPRLIHSASNSPISCA